MIYTIEQLKDNYKNYNNFFEKIKTEEKNQRLIKINRGLYTNSYNENLFHIANILSTPSYISFETALSFYDLIPERVNIIKSASFKKNKTKLYKTPLGTFYYQDINKKSYPFGIDMISIDGNVILIASKEKALTDMLSILSPRHNINELHAMLFDDLRINEYVFEQMDKNLLMDLCDQYPSKNLNLLKSYVRKNL